MFAALRKWWRPQRPPPNPVLSIHVVKTSEGEFTRGLRFEFLPSCDVNISIDGQTKHLVSGDTMVLNYNVTLDPPTNEEADRG